MLMPLLGFSSHPPNSMDPSFSWSDTARAAFQSCLAPCFPSSGRSSDPDSGYENPHRALTQNADLDRLLASDSETEALSLHSNLGGPRKKRRRPRKNITLFGYSLFGRPPIQLPDGEDAVDDLLRRPRRNSRTSTAPSTSTWDSDAPQLTPAVLDALSPETIEAQAAKAAEDERERRSKEDKQHQRRHKKEMKRVAAALAASNGSLDFEGFQGSGDNSYRNIPSPFMRAESQFSGSADSRGSRRQPYSDGRSPGPVPDDEDHESADLDGAMYSRPKRRGSSNGGSDSRSRTSASLSHHSPSQYSNSNPLHSPLPQEYSAHPPMEALPKKKTKKSKSSKSSSASRSTASSSEAQPKSPTLLSPHSEQDERLIHHEGEEFDGTPGGLGPSPFDDQALLDFDGTSPVGKFPASGLPSSGLGGGRGKGLQGVNAFLGGTGGF